MAIKHIITVGSRFTKLTAVEQISKWQWMCLCDCGGRKVVRHKQLIRGDNKSCGCLGTGSVPKHGHASKGIKGKSLTYKCWRSMMQRCYRVKDKNYARYGEKGITVCERWHDFINFLSDMGKVPDGLTIDRYPDKSGNYEPTNCRWATQIEQVRNRSNTVKLTFNGETKPLAEWAEITGIKYCTLRGRIDIGWSVEKSLTTSTHTIYEVSALRNKAYKEKHRSL